MIADSELRDDLDLVHLSYNPVKSQICIQPVEDNVTLFNPKTEFNNQSIPFQNYSAPDAQVWKKLTIPTKLPSHLAVTAILVDHLNKKDGNEFKYTVDQVLDAINKNEKKAKELV
jgi:hypothetical protein